MAQKITLSIPDMLYEKLKEWRTSFNLSKMFQEAVADAIQKKEEFQKRFSKDHNMAEIITRLKQEKMIWEKQFYQLGREEGLKWARTAHYEDLLYVLRFSRACKLICDPKMSDYSTKIYESASLSQDQYPDPEAREMMFMDGWFSGVMEFWNHVKEKL